MTTGRQRRIGILGGTFDPVHFGHLQMAVNAMETCALDEVRFVPAYAPPHKKDKEDNAEDRLAMLEAALQGNPAFIVDRREMEAKEKQYSYETVASFRKEFPDAALFFIMGEDSLMSIRTWYQWESLLSMIPVIVCARAEVPGDLIEQVQKLNAEGYCIQIAGGPGIDVSSTKIRQMLSEGREVRYLLPDAVSGYIYARHLYGASHSQEEAMFLKAVEDESLAFLDEGEFPAMVKRLRATLKPHRFRHVMRVVKTASFLARRYHCDLQKTRLAALLHDCAKSCERMYFSQLLEKGSVREEDWKPSPIFHAYLGQFVSRDIYGVEDPEVWEAIASHTTGSTHMSLLAKIVFLADEIEPHRNFPYVVYLREKSLENLDEAVLAGMNASLVFLLHSGSRIELSSITARNALLEQQHSCNGQ